LIAPRDHRKLFWRYLWQLIKLRRAGKIRSVLEVLLRTVPTAHHLIVWGRELLHDHAGLTSALLADLPSAPTVAPGAHPVGSSDAELSWPALGR
jgi:hypothetical protein